MSQKRIHSETFLPALVSKFFISKKNMYNDIVFVALAVAKSRKLEANIVMSGASSCDDNMKTPLVNFFTSSSDYTCLTKNTCTLTTSDVSS